MLWAMTAGTVGLWVECGLLGSWGWVPVVAAISIIVGFLWWLQAFINRDDP
jgi:hypothetical protein